MNLEIRYEPGKKYYYFTWKDMTWLEILNLYNMRSNNNTILDIVFVTLGIDRIGLMCHGSEWIANDYEVRWLDQRVSSKHEITSAFETLQYIIQGFCFDQQHHAEKCKAELEKQHIMRVLSN